MISGRISLHAKGEKKTACQQLEGEKKNAGDLTLSVTLSAVNKATPSLSVFYLFIYFIFLFFKTRLPADIFSSFIPADWDGNCTRSGLQGRTASILSRSRIKHFGEEKKKNHSGGAERPCVVHKASLHAFSHHPTTAGFSDFFLIFFL